MKAHLRNYVAAACLLAPAAITLTALPTAASAQQPVEMRAPEVRALEVITDGGVEPGSRLRFRMEASSRGEASVRVRGIRGSIPLREVERGIYVGRYVVTNADRIEPGAPVRAMIKRGNRTAVAEYNVPNDVRQVPGRGPNVVQVPQAPGGDEVRILRVNNWPAERPGPGAVVRFSVEGTPGARVWVAVPGVQQSVRLDEVRPGFYEGGYELTPQDRPDLRAPAVAYMRLDDRTVTVNFERPIFERR